MTNSAANKSAGKRKLVSYSKYGYLFLAPFFIVFIIFQLWPLFSTFYYSLFNYVTRYNKESITFYGFRNYLNVLGISAGEHGYFFTYLGNTLVMWIFNFIPQILLSLLLASWLTDERIKTKGRGLVKILIYTPNIITAASISVMFNSFVDKGGPLITSLQKWHIVSKDFNTFMSVGATRGCISTILTWMWYGNTTILLIAGMLGINKAYYEAADIDGCGGFKKFTKITLPSLKPIFLFVLVTSAIGGIQMYDIPALFNASQYGNIGLPDDKTTSMLMYVMRLHQNDIGKAAAISVLMFIICVACSLVLFRSMKEKVHGTHKHKHNEGV